MGEGTHPASVPPQTAAEAAAQQQDAGETQPEQPTTPTTPDVQEPTTSETTNDGPTRVQGFGKRETAGERIAEEMTQPR